jgi:hypothetical protein
MTHNGPQEKKSEESEEESGSGFTKEPESRAAIGFSESGSENIGLITPTPLFREMCNYQSNGRRGRCLRYQYIC